MIDGHGLSSILKELEKYDSAMIANTIDVIGGVSPHEIYMSGEIHSLTPSLAVVVGIAATCKLDTSTPGGMPALDLYWRQLESIEKAANPIVWVVEPIGERPNHECIMGDGMASTLRSVGCQGVVTSGRLRDVEGLLGVQFAAFARGTCVHHCAMRYREIDTPVQVGGIPVVAGDIIHASAEGVIKIPVAIVERVIEAAPRMQQFEQEAHALLRDSDVPLSAKRERVKEMQRKYGFG